MNGKLLENLFSITCSFHRNNDSSLKKTYGAKSFIIKRRVVGTSRHRSCLNEAKPMCTNNISYYKKRKKHFEVYNYKVSCPMSVPLLSISKCQYLNICPFAQQIL